MTRPTLHLLSRSALAFTFGAAIAGAAMADPGDLSADWGLLKSGKAKIAFDLGGNLRDTAAATMLGADGSLYLAGTVTGADGALRFGVVKLNPDGTPDDGFSGNGINTSSFSGLTATAAALSPSGTRLYVGGYTASLDDPAKHDFVLCQFDAHSGVAVTFPAVAATCTRPATFPGTDDFARDLVVQPDGRIVLAGTSAIDASTTFAAFARFNIDGSPDLTFGGLAGSNMALVLDENVFNAHDVRAIAIAGNGKFIAVGASRVIGEPDLRALVIRLDADGTATSQLSFNPDGSDFLDTVFNDVVTVPNPVVPNDDAVIAGTMELVGDVTAGLLGKLPAVSNSFGNFGQVGGFAVATVPMGSLEFDDLATGKGGQFVVAGRRPMVGDAVIDVTRFSSAGVLDPEFGDTNGHAIIDFGTEGGMNVPAGVVLDGNDNIYLGASAAISGVNNDFFAAKLQLDGVFDDGFED